jgi:hypothetical protein
MSCKKEPWAVNMQGLSFTRSRETQFGIQSGTKHRKVEWWWFIVNGGTWNVWVQLFHLTRLTILSESNWSEINGSTESEWPWTVQAMNELRCIFFLCTNHGCSWDHLHSDSALEKLNPGSIGASVRITEYSLVPGNVLESGCGGDI